MTGHLGDLAQLFALGVLEPEAHAEIEAHLRDCDGCSVEVGRAEATVAALTDATVLPQEPPARLAERLAASASLVTPLAGRLPRGAVDRLRSWYAIAALFILGVVVAGGSIAQNVHLRRGLAQDDLAFATIATSHFRHTNFVGSPPAKVLYARDGSWAYLIVDVPDCNCRLVARDDGTTRELGTPQSRGNTATLLVPRAGRPHSLALVGAGGNVLATASLAY